MATPMQEPFERLQYARRKADYANATAAAVAFGWNVNTYRSHENGGRGFNPSRAARYAKAFHTSASWLLTGEGAGPQNATVGLPSQITIDPEDLRKIVALVLRSQGSAARTASDLADTVVACLSEPPLEALQQDVVRSFEVRFELQARQ